jgi:hypothetical protein
LLPFPLLSVVLDLFEPLDPVDCFFGAGQDGRLAAVAPRMSGNTLAPHPDQLGMLKPELGGTPGRLNVVVSPQEVGLVLLFLSLAVFQLLPFQLQAALFLFGRLLPQNVQLLLLPLLSFVFDFQLAKGVESLLLNAELASGFVLGHSLSLHGLGKVKLQLALHALLEVLGLCQLVLLFHLPHPLSRLSSTVFSNHC